jgi:polar amino acid transport system substrate-binding protein
MNRQLGSWTAAAVALAAAAWAAPAAAGILDEIKAKKEIVIGTEAGYAPFEFVKDGKIIGYHADILDLVMKDLTSQGVKVTQLDVPFQALLAGLQGGKFDAVVTALFATEERARRFAFTVPTAVGTATIITKADNGSVTKPEDLSGKVVGAPQGTRYLAAAKALSEELARKGRAPIKQVREYVGFAEIYPDVENGRLDATLNGLPNALYLIKQQPGKYKTAGQLGEQTFFSWATRKEDQELADWFSQRILALKKSGTLKELQQKWFGGPMDVPDQVIYAK